MALLELMLLSVQFVYGAERGECGYNGGYHCCTGQCEIGEGDCDGDEHCLDGLVCDHQLWWQDHCIAGTASNSISVHWQIAGCACLTDGSLQYNNTHCYIFFLLDKQKDLKP